MSAIILAAVAGLSANSADLSPSSQALLKAIAGAIDQARAQDAALPPPKDDTERILRLGSLDQAPRRVIVAWDFSTIPQAERPEAIHRASALIKALDQEDQAALLKLVPPEGWFSVSKYGRKAEVAAFSIIQHGDTQLQERFLPVLGRMVASGDVPGDNYALMYDRVEVSHNRPQLYGSQFRCDGGKWRPYPIRDPDQLDARRNAMGLRGTFADYKAHFDASPPCPQTPTPPPPGMKLD